MNAITEWISSHWQSFALCSALIVVWALVIVQSTRDDDGLKLPANFAARAFFVLSFLVGYIAVVAICVVAPDSINALVQNPVFSSNVGDMLSQVSQNSAFFGFVALFPLNAVPQIKQVTRHYIIWLHNEGYRTDDEETLRQHLTICQFSPPQSETDNNIEFLRQFNIHIAKDRREPLKFEVIDAWRKSCTLLRLLEKEARNKDTILSENDRAAIERIAESHRRKTELAMNIVRMFDELQGSTAVEGKLTMIASLLSDLSHSDRSEIMNTEAKVKRLLEDAKNKTPGDENQPMQISGRRLSEYVGVIEKYFVAEYRLMLEQLARLTAKWVFRAGDKAADQLEALKKLGFTGLGHIDRINFDHILWVIMLSFPVTFLSFLISSALINGIAASLQRPNFLYIASTVATTAALSVLIGTVWGSQRSLAQRKQTPWTSYVLAGLVAYAAFVAVHFISMGVNPNANSTLADRLPWGLGPFILTIGICWLSRIESWSWSSGDITKERLTDGALLGLIYAFAAIIVIVVHIRFGTTSGERWLARFQDGTAGGRVVTQVLRNLAVGFVIGYIILRDIRQIAHSHVILRETPPQGSRVVQVVGEPKEAA